VIVMLVGIGFVALLTGSIRRGVHPAKGGQGG
jgi:hypothetical protein